MILNVSSRTDIVAFYTPWFIKRYQEGYIDVRNPFNPKMVSRIHFKDVDAIFFCTKNPIPILSQLNKIEKPIIFHITITPYQKDIEPNIPPKGTIIEAIKKLSKMMDPNNIYIRYDPIFLSDKYNLNYHKQAFTHLCSLLSGHIKHIIISFIDDYKNVRKNNYILKQRPFTKEDYSQIGLHFSKIAKTYGMTVQTCFEEQNLVEYGFIKEECLSHTKAFQITGKTYKSWNARKERKCNCVEMVDIGFYNTCKHFCKYCYANFDEKQVNKNNQLHDPNSSLLIGTIAPNDIIKVRK